MVTQLLAHFRFSKTGLDVCKRQLRNKLELILFIAACNLIKFWALLKDIQLSLELWCSV